MIRPHEIRVIQAIASGQGSESAEINIITNRMKMVRKELAMYSACTWRVCFDFEVFIHDF